MAIYYVNYGFTQKHLYNSIYDLATELIKKQHNKCVNIYYLSNKYIKNIVFNNT